MHFLYHALVSFLLYAETSSSLSHIQQNDIQSSVPVLVE